jgi:hypothetical protein
MEAAKWVVEGQEGREGREGGGPRVNATVRVWRLHGLMQKVEAEAQVAVASAVAWGAWVVEAGEVVVEVGGVAAC